jgi:hypothetical protein
MRCNTRLVAAIIVFSICGFVSYPVDAGPPVAGARTTASDLPTVKLVELARAAKARFQPLPADHAAKAKAQLRQAIQRLELALRRGSSKNAQRWKEYLQWDQMMAELAKSEGPDVRQLSGIAAKYYQDHGSLELPVFTHVRDDLAAYLAALATAGDDGVAPANRPVAGVARKCRPVFLPGGGGTPEELETESVCGDLGATGFARHG